MLVSCRQVILELSNYIGHEVDAPLRRAMEEHLADCKHCTAILDGTRNVLRLICDERAFELPPDLSQRLYQKLKQETQPRG